MREHAKTVCIGCVLAVATTVLIAMLRTALESWLHKDTPLLIFVATTIVAAWYGGVVPGLLGTALGAGAGAYYFALPTGSLWVYESNERIWLAMFIVVGLMISFLCEALHAARRKAERNAAEAEENRRQLEEINRRKSDFLAVLGHELRNPLAAVETATALMQMDRVQYDVVRECRDVISRQASHISRLVDDLLDISRIGRGKMHLQLEPLELSRVLGQAIESSLPQIKDHRHRMDVAVSQEPVWVEGDSTRLIQVFANLLSNAAKYTPAGGRIRVSLATEGDEAVVRVCDTGVGIPAELLPRVFNLFEQVEGNCDRSEGGLGIGLSLVRQLVEMHRGTAEAFSDGPGKGSEFVVRLHLMSRTKA